jgi:hypothetical protein
MKSFVGRLIVLSAVLALPPHRVRAGSRSYRHHHRFNGCRVARSDRHGVSEATGNNYETVTDAAGVTAFPSAAACTK